MNVNLLIPRTSPFAKSSSPEEVMKHFFNAFSLEDLKLCLWELLETALVTDYCFFNEPEQRSLLLSIYMQLLECLEAGMKLYKIS